jgi:hypothetical protein
MIRMKNCELEGIWKREKETRSWCNRGAKPTFRLRLRKNHENLSISIASILGEIRSEHLVDKGLWLVRLDEPVRSSICQTNLYMILMALYVLRHDAWKPEYFSVNTIPRKRTCAKREEWCFLWSALRSLLRNAAVNTSLQEWINTQQ